MLQNVDTFALLDWSHMFLHGTWQPMDSFMCPIPEHEANSAAYHLFISIYCKRFDQPSFFFFFSESWFRLLKGILLVISTEQSEAQYVSCYICCGSLSRLSSNLNEFFICLQVSWNLMCRTEVSVYFHFQIAQAEKEIVMEAKEFNSHLIKDKGNHPQGEHVGILDYWLVFLKESRKKEMFYGFFF